MNQPSRFRSAFAVFALAFVFCFSAFGQCQPNQLAFDQAYWASQAPAVAALQSLSGAQLQSEATALAAQGYAIDVPIMVYKWDACLVMFDRQQAGYTWVPSALQPPIVVVPGITFNGVKYDPSSPPAGSIKVDTNAADYKPFNPPAPPVTSKSPVVLVGPLLYGNVYATVVGDSSPNGFVYSDARGSFTKTVVQTPFGNEAYWTLTKPAAQ